MQRNNAQVWVLLLSRFRKVVPMPPFFQAQPLVLSLYSSRFPGQKPSNSHKSRVLLLAPPCNQGKNHFSRGSPSAHACLRQSEPRGINHFSHGAESPCLYPAADNQRINHWVNATPLFVRLNATPPFLTVVFTFTIVNRDYFSKKNGSALAFSRGNGILLDTIFVGQ